MDHYFCSGSCNGISNKPGTCQTTSCEKKGEPLTCCDADENLARLEAKVDSTFRSAEKTRKYLFWAFIISVAAVVLPLIGLSFVIPQFLNSLNVYKVF